MTSTSPTIKSITAAFPKPVLPRIHGEPNRTNLILLHKLACANTGAVKSTQGGRFGHLALFLGAEECLAHRGQAFFPPHNPGDVPTPAPAGATCQQITQANESFKHQK
uniref:Uncharacterized protein n=1 Tax=Odontella aurita TaxID=265563 RepID=A0A7S4NHV3_9STRA|mmetsp:Transcript_7062/g.21104  ORF Transcript_7062/g.21104 Transcript_7062/m.21104 type:complete len:108 (+) Transcript_7062:129-452(+)